MQSAHPESKPTSFWDEVDLLAEDLAAFDLEPRLTSDRHDAYSFFPDRATLRHAIYCVHFEGVQRHTEDAKRVSLWAQDPRLALEVVRWGAVPVLGRMLETLETREEALKGLTFLAQHLPPKLKGLLKPAVFQALSLIQACASYDRPVISPVSFLKAYVSDGTEAISSDLVLKCVLWRFQCDQDTLIDTEIDDLLDLLSQPAVEETLSAILKDWAETLDEDRRNQAFSEARWIKVLNALRSAKASTCAHLLDLWGLLHTSSVALSRDSLRVFCDLLSREGADVGRRHIITEGLIKFVLMSEVSDGCTREDKIHSLFALLASEINVTKRGAMKALGLLLKRPIGMSDHRMIIESHPKYLKQLDALRVDADPYLRAESEAVCIGVFQHRELLQYPDRSRFEQAFEVSKMNHHDDYAWMIVKESLEEEKTQSYRVRRYSADHFYLSSLRPSGHREHYLCILSRRKIFNLARDWDFSGWGLGRTISTDDFRSCVDEVLVHLASSVIHIDFSENEDSEASESLSYLFSRVGLSFPNLRTVHCSKMNLRWTGSTGEASSEEKAEKSGAWPHWMEAMFDCFSRTAPQLAELDLSKNTLDSLPSLCRRLNTLRSLSCLRLDGVSLHAAIIDYLSSVFEDTLEDLFSAPLIDSDEARFESLMLQPLEWAIRVIALPSLRRLSLMDCDLSWLDWGFILFLCPNMLCIEGMHIKSDHLGEWPKQSVGNSLIREEYWNRARSTEWVCRLLLLFFYAPKTQKRFGSLLRNTRLLSIESHDIDPEFFAFLSTCGPLSLRVLKLSCNGLSERLREALEQAIVCKIMDVSIWVRTSPEGAFLSRLRENFRAYLPLEQRSTFSFGRTNLLRTRKIDMLNGLVRHVPGSANLLGFLYTMWLCQLAQGREYVETSLSYADLKAEPDAQASALLGSILVSFLSIYIKKNEDTRNLAWPHYFLSGANIDSHVSLWVDYSDRIKSAPAWLETFSEHAKLKIQEVVACAVEDLVDLRSTHVVRLTEPLKKELLEAVWDGRFMAPHWRLKQEGRMIYLINDVRPEQGGRVLESARGYQALGIPKTLHEIPRYRFSDFYLEEIALCLETASDLLSRQAPSAIDCIRMRRDPDMNARPVLLSVLSRLGKALSQYGHDLPREWSFRSCHLTSKDLSLGQTKREDSFDIARAASKIHRLDLSRNRLEKPWGPLSKWGESLFELDLSHNSLSFSPRSGFRDFADYAKRLRVLHLRKASVSADDCVSIFTALPQLYRLDLSGNRLEVSKQFNLPQLPEPFELKILSLRATSVPANLLNWLQHAQHLEELDLSEYDLEELDLSEYDLEELDLSEYNHTEDCLETLSQCGQGDFLALKRLLLWGSHRVSKEVWARFHKSPLSGRLERLETDDREGLRIWQNKHWGLQMVAQEEVSESKPSETKDSSRPNRAPETQSDFFSDILHFSISSSSDDSSESNRCSIS